MISIVAMMDEKDIAQQVVMERMVHKGSFLIVEGLTDVLRFRPFIAEGDCSIVPCTSVVKAIKVIRILEARKFSGALAVIDRDFSDFHGPARSGVNIVCSEYHDLDSDWIHSKAIGKYLMEVGDESAVTSLGGATAVLDAIKVALRPVSNARLLGYKRVIKCRTSGVDVGKFFSLTGDLLAQYCAALVSYGYTDASKTGLIEILVREEMKKPKDDYLITNGHDIHCALGNLLQSTLGSRRVVHAWGSEVEKHIRIAFHDADFRGTKVFSDVRAWEAANVPFRILDARL